MKTTGKIFELKFSKDREVILSLSYPRWMNFFVERYFKLRIYKPYPICKEANFDLKYKNDGNYREPFKFEEWMNNYFEFPNTHSL